MKRLISSSGGYGSISAAQIETLRMATRNARPEALFPIATLTEHYDDDSCETLVVLNPGSEIEMHIRQDGTVRRGT